MPRRTVTRTAGRMIRNARCDLFIVKREAGMGIGFEGLVGGWGVGWMDGRMRKRFGGVEIVVRRW